MKATDIIAISVEGSVSLHITSANGDYATICGLDSEDYCQIQPGSRSTKITCRDCFAIWEKVTSLRIKRVNFEVTQ